MKCIFLVLSFALFSGPAFSLVTVGGYVPFGPSTQKEVTGSRNTFSFDPMIGVNTIFPTPFYGQLFLPEFAMVFHGSGTDGYSKRTMAFLFDFGFAYTDKLIFRYGIGTFLTSISGNGGTTTLPNGSSTRDYTLPGESKTSYNTTLNLGIESSVDTNYAFRFQTYLFSLLDGEARKFSYSINVIYYL